MMDAILLKVVALRKHFIVRRGFPKAVKLTVRAVDDVSFQVQRGEAFGLVGESGCGKSTVGRSLLRLIEPDAGAVLLDGEDFLQWPQGRMSELRQKIQIIFQDPSSSLNPRRTIGQTLSEPLRVHRLIQPDNIRERVSDLLRVVGLNPEVADKYPHEFSGGQRQRVGIARALLFTPKLVIADEPVSALDVSIQSQILQLLEKLKSDHGLAFLFISHDLAVVRSFCRRLGVMYLGRIVEQGPVDAVFDQPAHPYTKLLKASSPIPDPTVIHEFKRVEGEVPSAINPPGGCHFHPRCPERLPICKEAYPAVSQLDAQREVACHLYT
jgi:oligopeptide/dipeptide ABC transporter ATP-binding protein